MATYLGDSAEPEHIRIPELCHVLQGVGRMLQSIRNKLVQATNSLLRILWGLEVLQLLCILPPDLLRPEHPAHDSRAWKATTSKDCRE